MRFYRAMGYTQDSGNCAEQRAERFLKQNGLKLITRNFRSKLGEIDLIMFDKPYIVFIEVKMRRKNSHGGGLQAITPTKMQRIIRTSKYFLIRHKQHQIHPSRFDVVALSDEHIAWIKHAFDASCDDSFL